MSILLDIFAFLFVLGVIVLVHEGGHFLFARKVNILCREYAFGMGPILWKKKKGETTYSIRAFPIGGFVAIAGEEVEGDLLSGREAVKLHMEDNVIKGIYLQVEDPSIAYPVYKLSGYDMFDATNSGELYLDVESESGNIRLALDPQAIIYDTKIEHQIAPFNRTIGSKKKRDRAMVVFGGPMMNFLLALLVFFIAGLLAGFTDNNSTALEGVASTSPAAEAGLQKNDLLLSLSSGDLVVEMEKWHDISVFFDQYRSEDLTGLVTVRYLRDGNEYTTNLRPRITLWNILATSDITTDELKIGSVDTKNTSMMNNSELKVGDVVVAVNGVNVVKWQEIMAVLDNFVGGNKDVEENKVFMTVIRDGQTREIEVYPYSKQIMENQTTLQGESIPTTRFELGVFPKQYFNIGKSFVYSGSQTINSATAVVGMFELLFGDSTVTIGAISGPAGIFSFTAAFAKQGMITLLNWMGLLSVNVGLLNLLPIPALDGGRLLFIGYEAVTKKKPNPKVETALITITMLLLFGFLIFVTFNDIFGFFK